MALTTAAAQDTAALDRELNAAILTGDILGAFDRFYAEDVRMQENNDPPTIGKYANRIREQEFLSKVAEFHGARLIGNAIDGDMSFSEWEIDATYKAAGRFVLSQVAVRHWRDGKVAQERFYYSKD